MEFDEIINQIINNFDWAYMLSVNVLTYMIIRTLDIINGKKQVSTIIKKIVLIICVIILAIAYKLIDNVDNRILLNSAILAPVAWDYVLRPLIRRIGLGYKLNDEDSDTE